VPTLGAMPERGELSAAKPGCRARFLFGYFLFCASKEKVTRRGAKPVSKANERAAEDAVRQANMMGIASLNPSYELSLICGAVSYAGFTHPTEI
jgi:hypothetical protein